MCNLVIINCKREINLVLCDRRRPISMDVYVYVYGHMTERSNERKGFKYLSVYSKQAQAAAIKNINAKKNACVFSSGDLKQ